MVCPKCGAADRPSASPTIERDGPVAFCTVCAHTWRLEKGTNAQTR